jgi:cell division protein YceG involved in septum cleavage
MLAGLALLAFCLSFVAISVALNLTQPTSVEVNPTVRFAVRPGESVGEVASQLRGDGLIHSALVFQAVATTQRLSGHLRPGIYELSADMTMGDILARLAAGHPDDQLIIAPPGKVAVILPPGLRVAQYPAHFTGLAHFDAASFLKIAQTGVLPNGKKLSDLYWYVAPKQPRTVAALEGYLLPGVYFVDAGADESAAIQQMLDALGARLCPGPDATHPNAYLHDAAACKAHAALVGPKKTSIFAEMEAHQFTKDDVQALYRTLTLAALVVRISASDADAPGVAAVYDNRLSAWKKNAASPAGEYVQAMDSLASAQYASESDHPPSDGNWWAPLTSAPALVDAGNLYNTTVLDHAGLPPGPIAAPTWADVVAAASANEPSASPNYYVTSDRCGRAAYAKDFAAFQTVAAAAQQGCLSAGEGVSS